MHGPSQPVGLFSALAAGSLKLRNRIVMAPMTRERATDGAPGNDVLAYYERRAAGGVGLIITEGMPPDLAGAFGATVPRFFGPQRDAWRPVVRAVHAHGASIIPQLWHVGAFDPSLIGMADSVAIERLSPSGLAAPGRTLGRSMSAADVSDTIAAYAQAASGAQTLGFDGVEIHGAHGYLPDQFLWQDTNRRTDGYGGDLAGRTRFAVELVQACRRATGPSFPIVFRFSQWKQLDYSARLAATPQELGVVVQALVQAGVDVFHCSTRRYWEPAFAGDDRSLACWTRLLGGKPVIAVGSASLSNEFKSPMGKVRADIDPQDIARMAQGLERGDYDLIALGRALIANPQWVQQVQTGRVAELRSFTKDMLESLY
jgi:2,4-dienoyl-CoA reductase-like NADH-dependent reductase (Old Yellow Enzyme family)